MKAVILFSLICVAGSRNLNQRVDESGMNLEDGEIIWEGDMILTKEQVKKLYGKEPETSDGDQNYLFERHYPSDDFGAGLQIREGDLLLSEDQIQVLYGEAEEIRDPSEGRALWPNGIVPYKIDPSALAHERNIRNAMRIWEYATCLKFVQYTGNWFSGNHVGFVTNTSSPLACNSNLGMNGTGNHGQNIHLGQECRKFRTVLHEIGHAIGFLHEQSRMDRDNYVKIFEENVNKTYFDNNFSKQKSMHDFDDIPYDYRSVMHYEMTSASINGENTIVPHKPEHTLEVGQDFGLSFTDIKLANLMYKCSEKCFNKPQCRPEGFVDKYCDCSCPIKYGPNCDYKITTVPACGGMYSKPVIIETPNYPDNPPPRTECIWEFKAPDGKNVTVNFQHFHLYERNDVHKICYGDQTHIRGGGFNGEHTYCGDDLNEKTLNIGPHENGTFVIFKFDEGYDGIKRGFIANVTFV